MKAHTVAGRVFPSAVFLCGALVPTAGCGASLQAVYEGDVRFERCMSLDVQPEVSPEARRACWSEWVSFYTYGQTRDRVLHAQLRIKQLGPSEPVRLPPEGAVDEGAGHQRTGKSVQALVPKDPPALADVPPPGAPRDPEARCVNDCQASHEQCGRGCNDAPCLELCERGHEVCVRKCS